MGTEMVGAAEEAEQIGRELLVEMNGLAPEGFPRSRAKAGQESFAREG